MREYLLLLVGTVLVNNFVLVKFLGLCPFMGVSRKVDTALGMGLATTFVITLSAVLSYAVDTFVLVPLGADYLRTIAFILVIAVAVQFTEMVVHKVSPLLYRLLGIYLPLITTNCAVLAVTLLNISDEYNLLESCVDGFSAGVGFGLALILFCGVRKSLERANPPKAFQGLPITLVAAALTSMTFMGFTGIADKLFA